MPVGSNEPSCQQMEHIYFLRSKHSKHMDISHYPSGFRTLYSYLNHLKTYKSHGLMNAVVMYNLLGYTTWVYQITSCIHEQPF